MLFEEATRDYLGMKPPNMNLYHFMLKSTKPAVLRACATWEKFFSTFPCTKRDELLDNFRSSKQEKNIAATFELFLASFFQKLGYEIEGLKRPDFLVRNGTEAYYLEACCVFPDFTNTSSNTFKSAIVREINSQVTSRSFRACALFEGHIDSPPRIADVIRAIQDVVQEWEANVAQVDLRPLRKKLKVGQLTIELSPIRRTAAHDGMKSFVALHSNNLTAVQSRTVERVRKALRDKANKYEKAYRPLILAINVVEAAPFSDEEVLEVLFGTEKLEVLIENGEIGQMLPGRYNEGFWRYGTSSLNTSIPAIMFFHNLGPLDLSTNMAAVYFSPYNDLTCSLAKCPYLSRFSYDSQSDTYKSEVGRSYMDFLGLDDNWPN